jgi:hypothetical protein
MNRFDADERLRQGLAAAPGGHGDDCPDPDRLWAGAHGELRRDELVVLVDHVSACGECAEAWSILAGNESDAAAAPRSRRRSWAPAIGAVAATLVVGAGVATWVSRGDRPASEFRGVEQDAIVSLHADDELCPREDARLQWSGGPAGTRYAIVVTDETLRTLDRASGLETPEHVLSAEALEQIPPGARILWRVEATLPDGSVENSRTFLSRIE